MPRPERELPEQPEPLPRAPSHAQWRHDGAVVREQSAPEVYLLFGGARFHIGSPDELLALGLTWSQVVLVPDGALASFARVPNAGTLLKARDRPEIWHSNGDQLWWVPSPDAMRLLGLAWNHVHVVPSGSLDSLPTVRLASASSTPASVAFPPNKPNHWPRNEVPGFTLPNGVRVVEVRGWLREVKPEPDASDPDWHLHIEPDPAWLDHIGVNWSTFFKVGDILAQGWDPLTDDNADQHGRVATPMLHLEVNGWEDAKHPGVDRPTDWDVDEGNNGQLPGVTWPFLPTVTGGRPGSEELKPGQYVRAVGSLIHDMPHYHAQGGAVSEWFEHNLGIGRGNAYNAAAQDWGGNVAEQDEGNPARWTEMHPPDLIVRLEDKDRTEALYGVVAVARAAATNPFGHDQEVSVDLRPPAQRPVHSKAAVVEYVGPETRFASIVEGNAAHNGAAITLFNDRAHIHVKVHGDGFAGAPGKFKAVYRLSWVPDPASYRLRVELSPSTVPANVPVTVTVSCTDADTGLAVAGVVRLGSTNVGATGAALTVTFVPLQKQVWEPGDPTGPASGRKGHWVWENTPPSLTVEAAGYPATEVAFDLA